MRKALLFILTALSSSVFAQQKVAIYVTGPDTLDISIKEIVGSELVSGIVLNKDYVAVERTADFLQEIGKEQSYQRSGNVDDEQISEIGRQFGVDLVCVAKITPFKNANSAYLSARLINVEAATVLAAATEKASLASLEELIKATENLSSKLVGTKAVEIRAAAEVLAEEYSIIQKGDPYMQPIEIDNTGTYTRFVFKFATPQADRIRLAADCYAQDNKSGKKYKCIGASGISADAWTNVEAGIHTFTLTCEKLPDNIESLTLYQNEALNWVVQLVPYGKRNYFRFEDRMNEAYKAAVDAINKKAAQQKQLEESASQLGEAIGSFAQTIADAANPTYYLYIVNNHMHTRNVYVDGKFIGEIGGLSTKTFVVLCKYYKEIKLVQKNYIFSPSIETYTNSTKPTANQQIKVVNNP